MIDTCEIFLKKPNCRVYGLHLWKIKDFRAELKDFRTDTELDIKKIMLQTKDLRQDMETMNTRVSELETRFSELKDKKLEHQKAIKYLNSCISKMGDHKDYIENKSRQNNVCIYNIAEHSVGKGMTAFIQKLFKEVLLMEKEPQSTWTQRIGIWKEVDGLMRPIIVNFVNYDSKRGVLKAAWSKKESHFDATCTKTLQKKWNNSGPCLHLCKNYESNRSSHTFWLQQNSVFSKDGTAIIYSSAELARKDLAQKGLYKSDGETEMEQENPTQQWEMV